VEPGDGVVVVGCVAGLGCGSFGVGEGGAIAPDSGAGADEPGPDAAGAAGEVVAGCAAGADSPGTGVAGGVAGAAGRMITGLVFSGSVSGPL
jgi:hypothetical protein